MTLPNFISLFRILLVPIFFTFLVSYQEDKEFYRYAALAVFLMAVVSDALDGFIARAWKKQTALGEILDPLADKLLLLSGYLGLFWVDALTHQLPLWVTVTIVFRDMVILIGLAILFVVTGRLNVQTNQLGKITTVFQMLTLVLILLQYPVSILCGYMTAGLTMVSCGVYVFRDLNKLNGD